MLRDKRMFSRKVVESDAFLDMGASAQNLYFHLALNADDEGFVSAPKKIMRMIGAAEDDLKMLLAKRFILGFESGVVVIKHWLMNNQLRPERIAKSDYEEERGKLYTKINGAYTFDQAQGKPLLSSWRRTDNQLSSSCRQVDAKLTTECGEMYGIKDKTRQDKTRQDKKKSISAFAPPSVEEVAQYCQERNNGIDPEQFVNFYASKGWKVGKNSMKDWRAAVRTWEQRRKAENSTKGQKNADFLKELDEWAKEED